MGRPSSGARSLSPPKREPAPAARTTAPIRAGCAIDPASERQRQARAAASSSIGRPEPPCRSATISARIARAVSAGARPPRSSPIGPWSRASSVGGHPGGQQAFPTIGLGLARADRADVAAAPPERLDDRRLVELHVVAEDRDRVRRPEADLVGHLVRPADHEPVDGREPLGAWRRRAARRRRRSRSRARRRGRRAGWRPGPHPTTTSRGRTGYASTNNDRPPSSTVRDVPLASASSPARTSSASRPGSPSEPLQRPVVVDGQDGLRRLAGTRAHAARTPVRANRPGAA